MTGLGNELFFTTFKPAGPTLSHAKNIATSLSEIQRTERDAYYSSSPSTDVKVRTLQSNRSPAFHSADLGFKSLTRDRPSRLRCSHYFPQSLQAHAGTIPEVRTQSLPSTSDSVH
jgi:hypothetical protein